MCGRVANFKWNFLVEKKLNNKICLVVWWCVKEAIDLVITRGGQIFVQPDPITRSPILEHIYERIHIWILILFGFRMSHGFHIVTQPNKYKYKKKKKKKLNQFTISLSHPQTRSNHTAASRSHRHSQTII